MYDAGPMADSWRRLYIGFVLVIGVIGFGSVGFHLIGSYHGYEWAWWDCIYMTVITVSTVGYGEVLPIHEVHGARVFAIFLILFGMGMLLYFASAVVTMVVEVNVKEVFRKRALRKAVAHQEDHIIVCGAGTTGIHVIEELVATHTPFVVVEQDQDRLQWIAEHLEVDYLRIIGDATEDDVLIQAGIEKARGVVAALSSDKDNLFITITARQLNDSLRIISRAKEISTSNKLKRAGADAVVSPNYIGGMRMVSEMIRPEVVEFLDLMLRNKDKTLRIEEVGITDISPLRGKTLAETNIRKVTRLLVIAARAADGTYHYNPGPSFRLECGTTLIVLGESQDVSKLRQRLDRGHW